MESLLIPIALLAFLVYLVVRSRLRSRAATIKSPSIGFLDLSGGEFTELLREDKNALSPLFESPVESSSTPPKCNVLFLYFRLTEDGGIQGSNHRLRELVRDSGASVAVVATDNPGPHYKLATKKTGFGNANLVMTLNRKGHAFSRFFQQLFSLMKQGKSMPIAWVKLAPQIPGQEHPDCPDTFFVCEAGQVSFK